MACHLTWENTAGQVSAVPIHLIFARGTAKMCVMLHRFSFTSLATWFWRERPFLVKTMLVRGSSESAKVWAASQQTLDGTELCCSSGRWNYISVTSVREFSCSIGETIQSLECCVKSDCAKVFL